ncbi:hypothetical protein [Nostoc sp.]|uniref:hypothetical protein n=1 Tax=Nostoc sp. TaxID=1180 RepID=UPI002FFBED15
MHGFPSLHSYGEASYAQRHPLGEATGVVLGTYFDILYHKKYIKASNAPLYKMVRWAKA